MSVKLSSRIDNPDLGFVVARNGIRMGAGASAVPALPSDDTAKQKKITRAAATEKSLSMVGKLLRDAIETQKISVLRAPDDMLLAGEYVTGLLWGDHKGLQTRNV